ncbi:MAG: AAA family ATPase [Desulfurococcaceae archaeon]
MVIYIFAYTGRQELDELIERHRSILFYGVAGSGKTTMLLTIAKNLCKQDICVYISTEGTLHYERIAREHDAYGNTLFSEIYDLDELINTAIFLNMVGIKYIFVDSINAPYRMRAMDESSIVKQALLISIMIKTVEETNGKLFASAQVRTGEEGYIEAVGHGMLEYYFDLVVNLGIDGYERYAKIMKPNEKIDIEKKMYFKITDKGVEWIDKHI